MSTDDSPRIADAPHVQDQLGHADNPIGGKAPHSAGVESRLAAQITELRLEVAAKQLMLDACNAEIHDLRRQISASGRQYAESLRMQAAPNAGGDNVAAAGPRRVHGAGDQSRDFAIAMQQKNAEIDRLRAQIDEARSLLLNRNEQLVLVKSEMDQLHDRVNDLESEARHQEQMTAGDSEQIRTELQAQIAFLQAELSQSAWALEDREATIGRLRLKLNSDIRSLDTKIREGELLAPDASESATAEDGGSTSKRCRHCREDLPARLNQSAGGSAWNKRRWRTSPVRKSRL